VQGLRLSSKVASVTLLQQNASGEVTPVVLFKSEKKKKRRTTVGLRIAENVLEQLLDAGKETATSYRRRFRDSSRAKRDGWLVDMGPNMFKAVRDGARTIRLERII